MSSPIDTLTTTPAPIAFVSRHDGSRWIEMLTNSMPRESVVDDNTISDAVAMTVEIAVVADPSPGRLARYPNLKWVHSVWAGVERLVPIVAARQLPLVRLVDPMLATTMAEAVLAWTLYLHRDMPAYAAQQRQRVWKPHGYVAADELTISILGLGELGGAAAERLVEAGYRVTGWSHSAKTLDGVRSLTGEAGLREALSVANIVVLLLPLTAETQHLLNAERLALMREGASLINFARGGVLDTSALIQALDDDRLNHAVLDVFDEEPLPQTSPLWNHQKVTVLPHISAPTNRVSASGIVAANIGAYRDTGAIPVVVDAARGY
jgi:glyoxylate/hydroxypyruvate reductase A